MNNRTLILISGDVPEKDVNANYSDLSRLWFVIRMNGGYLTEEELIEYMKQAPVFSIMKVIKSEIVSVKHGYWDDYGAGVCCSNCGVSLFHQDENNNAGINPSGFDYCPYCGALMDLEDPQP